MKYRFETEYNLTALTAMARGLRKTVRKKRSRRSHILGWVVVVLSVMLMMSSANGSFTLNSKNTVTLLAAGAIVIALIFEDKLNGYFAQKRMLKGTEKAVAVFDTDIGDAFSSRTAAGKSEFYYDNIAAIAKTKNYFVFILSDRYGQVYDINGLTGGTAEDFSQFISEKTGKPVINAD